MPTVKSGYWNDSYSFTNGNNPNERQLKRLMRRRGMRPVQELILTLLGAVAGSTASVTYKRVAGQGNSGPSSVGALGGARLMETRTQISRVTTAADVTRITDVLTRGPKATVDVHDASGNGK